MILAMTSLAYLRRQRGWSQAELARRSGLHPSTISLAESGRFRLSNTQLQKIGLALGVPGTEADTLLCTHADAPNNDA